MFDSFLVNGQGHGSVAKQLLASNMDPGALRPFFGKDGRSYVTLNERQNDGSYKPVVRQTHNTATLRKDEWILLDRTIMVAARQQLRAVADLRARGLVYNLPNGMGTTFLQHQTMGNITPATISMNGLRKADNDRPEFDIAGIPVPIIHKDFQFNARELAVSRSGGPPLDMITAELAGRRVAEEIEKLQLGTAGTFAFGGGTLYGYTNFPGRVTVTLSDPTAAGWTPADLLADILEMKQAAMDNLMYGPYALYWGVGWGTKLDDDYSAAYPGVTVRDRIARVAGIALSSQLDLLTGYQILMVQLTPDVVRTVNGMDITTVQWEEQGGMELHYKVMAIQIPQIRSDPDSNCGIIHGNI
jgi:hypothetical protein